MALDDTRTPAPVNTPAFWDEYMREAWERNGGREQTRLFAHYFLERLRLPHDAKTLLDCSCAMGDAIPEFRRCYPELELHGMDVSPTAVRIAQARFASMAAFAVGSLRQLDRSYDVIYCSNTLEHFEDHLDVAASLLRHCQWLYVMVPYREFRNGRSLSAETGEQHVATFDRRTFRWLVRHGSAVQIRTMVLRTPGAWDGVPPPKLRSRLKAWVLRRPPPLDYRQLIVALKSSGTPR